MALPQNFARMIFSLHASSGIPKDDAVTTIHFRKGELVGDPFFTTAQMQGLTDNWLTFLLNSLSNTLKRWLSLWTSSCCIRKSR